MVGAGGDVEMTDAFAPPTPVSADLKSRLANIFKKIGEKSTTAKGLEELYDFSRAYPMVDIQPHLARTSGAFQGYIKRGLAKVEAARAQQAAAKAAAAAGPRPRQRRRARHRAESDAADGTYRGGVYRERLAAMAAAKAAGGKAAPAAARPASTSAGLHDSSRTNGSHRGQGGGGAAGGATGGTAGGAGDSPDAQQTFEDLQARMERIRVGTSAPRQSDESSFSGRTGIAFNDERADARTNARRDETHVCVFTENPFIIVARLHLRLLRASRVRVQLT